MRETTISPRRAIDSRSLSIPSLFHLQSRTAPLPVSLNPLTSLLYTRYPFTCNSYFGDQSICVPFRIYSYRMAQSKRRSLNDEFDMSQRYQLISVG